MTGDVKDECPVDQEREDKMQTINNYNCGTEITHRCLSVLVRKRFS